jgi:glycosyltransferase involved in cell wall biosynthesis
VKIAIWHNLPSGGGKRALYDHVKGLSERGHYLEAWCPPTADQTYLPLRELCEEHIVPLSIPRPWPWLRRGRTLVRYRTTSQGLSAMDDHCRECASEINRGDFDVLFANSCLFYQVAPIAKHVRIPSVIYLQEPYRGFYEASPRLPWAAPSNASEDFWSLGRWSGFVSDKFRIPALRLQMREEIENASKFNTILVNSLYSRESILRAYGLESKVCYLGIDPECFRPSGEPIASYVMGLGGLAHNKGVDRAIRALGCVDSHKRPELLWVGNFSSAEYEKELQTLAARSGVRLTVKIRVSDKELGSLLSRAAMLLYTSRLEPFGLAPLEANACGTPVVAIAEGGVRETIEHEQNGLLVDGDDPKKLARLIERLIDNPEFAAELRERSLRYVRAKWHIKDAVDRLEAALFETIGGDASKVPLTPRQPPIEVRA